MVLLENPKGDNKLDFTKLVTTIACIFGLEKAKVAIYSGKQGK